MIGTIDIRCNAAKPNFPLQPMFAFQGSPSSLRILDVPKSIGTWEISTVKVAISYPDNTTKEKTAVRTGSVWVATIEGCEIAGKVAGGYQVTADGIDEDGNAITGYVLGKGDVFVLDDNIDVKALVEKVAVRYLEDMPSVPTVGDFIEHNGQMNFYDGEKWIVLATGGEIPTKVSQLENDVGYITESAIPSDISHFNNDVGYITASAVPTKVSELENDAGYITTSALPSKVSELDNDVGYVTASAVPTKVSQLQNDSGYLTDTSTTITKLGANSTNHEYRIRETEKQATGARDYMDLEYPTVNADPQDGFGIDGFNVRFPQYNSYPAANVYIGLYSVSAGVADWYNSSMNLEVRSSNGVKFSYYNNGQWVELPINKASTEVWSTYRGTQGIRPAFITPSFKNQTMKKFAFMDDLYSKTQVDTMLSQKQNALDEDEVTMIGQVTDERKTVITFTDNTSEEYEWYGEITRQNIVDAGLWDVDHGGWIREPISIKVGTAVTRLGNYAFANAHYLTSIGIPSTVTNIGQYCLYDCQALTSVVIPYSMKTIGSDTFGLCSSLTSVTIPNSVESIGAAAFENCTSLSTLLIPDSVTSIGTSAFIGCTSLTNLKIPDNVTSIGEGAFWGSGIQTITIGSSVASIGENAFRDASGVTSAVFRGKTLTQVQGMTDYPWQLNTSTISTWNDTSKEYVDGIVGTINTALDNINGEVI